MAFKFNTARETHFSQIAKYNAGRNKIAELTENNLVDALLAQRYLDQLEETHDTHQKDGTLSEINIGDYAYDIVEGLKDGTLK